MFMFRSRRTTLAKRLWKARVTREQHAAPAAGAEPQDMMVLSSHCFGGGGGSCSESSLRALLKRLKESQLEALLAAVETRGADLSACVLVARDLALGLDPLLLCCQTWRWPDLRLPCEIKKLPVCCAAPSKDPVHICCNPYHWSRLCKPESPPPPYCMLPGDRCRYTEWEPSDEYSWHTDRLSTCYGSFTTNGEGDATDREWCKLAYWELATRVGRLFSVEVPAVNVFTSLPQGDGLCLATLARSLSPVPHDSVRRTRAKIGLGVMLSLEGDGVWAYNRSDSPIFVNSPTLDGPESRTLLVYRVPSGHCLNIFDLSRAAYVSRWPPAAGPVDRNSVRISFAKGWGPKYSRQEVTACPCWLEVLLVPCR